MSAKDPLTVQRSSIVRLFDGSTMADGKSFDFREPSNPNSSINLNGVHSKYLNNVLNYIYEGEVEVLQDDLDTFMNIAHQLKVNGLFKDQEAESKDNDYLT